MRRTLLTAPYALLLLLLSACNGGPAGETTLGAMQPGAAGVTTGFLRGQLEKLETLPAPKGVTAAEWAGLRSALADSIRQRLSEAHGGKSTLSAPTSDLAQTRLRYNHDDASFDWRLYNPGDYDQNGEVNVSDLTPLAVHLGDAVPAGPDGANTIASVVDGDGNGLVTIADITPLGAHLGRLITRFSIYSAFNVADIPDENGEPSTVVPFGFVPFSAAQGNSTVERVWFSIPDTGTLTDANYYWVRPEDGTDNSEGTPSTLIDSHEDFLAVLEASPLGGPPVLPVVFNAGESTNGDIYAFDVDGDGIFSSSISSEYQTSYDTVGEYTAVARVESLSGHYGTAEILINVSEAAPEWRSNVVAVPADSFDPTGIGLLDHDGRPTVAVSYTEDADTHRIMSMFAATSSGGTWGGFFPIYSSANPLDGPIIMKRVFGRPAVAFGHGTGFRYCRHSGSAYPVNWGPVRTFDSVGPYFGMAAVVDEPFVAFRFDVGGNPTLEVNACPAPDGDELWARWPPLQGFSTPSQISCAEMNGWRAVTALNDGELIYVDGNPFFPPDTWDPPETIATDNITSFNSLISLADASPAIVYYSLDDFESIIFRRATSYLGNTWDPSDTVIIDELPGSGPALVPTAVMVGNIPYAFWIEPTTDLLYCAFATDEEGLDWAEAEIVDSDVDETVMCAGADIGGYPAVGYATESGEFRVAIKY